MTSKNIESLSTPQAGWWELDCKLCRPGRTKLAFNALRKWQTPAICWLMEFAASVLHLPARASQKKLVLTAKPAAVSPWQFIPLRGHPDVQDRSEGPAYSAIGFYPLNCTTPQPTPTPKCHACCNVPKCARLEGVNLNKRNATSKTLSYYLIM